MFAYTCVHTHALVLLVCMEHLVTVSLRIIEWLRDRDDHSLRNLGAYEFSAMYMYHLFKKTN